MLQSSELLAITPDAREDPSVDASVVTPQRGRKCDDPAARSPKPPKSPKSSTPLQQSTVLLQRTSSAFTEAKTMGSKVQTYTILILGLLTATFENPP